MDQGLLVMMWIASGAFIGGVITPLVTENKRGNGWLNMTLGVVAGMTGNVIFLIPLWLLLSQILPNDERAALPGWQRDMVTLAEVQAARFDGPPARAAVARAARRWAFAPHRLYPGVCGAGAADGAGSHINGGGFRRADDGAAGHAVDDQGAAGGDVLHAPALRQPLVCELFRVRGAVRGADCDRAGAGRLAPVMHF